MNILEYENYQEKISHGNPLFPYITYLCSIPLDFSYVPIHWHDEMELIYIKKGHGIITVDFTQYQVSAGTLALIIPGQLHSIEQYENESMEYENIIFHPQILLSKQTDTCSTDYFSPLMDGTLTVPVLPIMERFLPASMQMMRSAKLIRQLTSFSSKASFSCCFIFSSISAVPEMPRKKITSLWKK